MTDYNRINLQTNHPKKDKETIYGKIKEVLLTSEVLNVWKRRHILNEPNVKHALIHALKVDF